MQMLARPILVTVLVPLLAGCPARYMTRPPSLSESAAVVALVEAARSERAAGRLDNAAAAYERALRIEPANAELWHRLAQLRFDQQQYRQAINIANKSNALAGRQRILLARNWQLIAEAHRKLGEQGEARAAHEKARRFEKGA
jgi:tetratricopeptide (TPR) repeat protein